MTLLSLLPLLAALIMVSPATAESGAGLTTELVALERQAMDGWLKGDPGPQLAITDPDITFYHVMLEKRIEGLPALKELYERYRGRPLFDGYEVLAPKVSAFGEVAILTYTLERRVGGTASRWNGTQVYHKTGQGWKVIHTHWSEAGPRP